jgi:DNA-binding NarL/FixJ family response regulator
MIRQVPDSPSTRNGGRRCERQVLALASAASNKEIADRLCLAEGTVKNHVTNILTKLDVRDRTKAAVRARQLGVI